MNRRRRFIPFITPELGPAQGNQGHPDDAADATGDDRNRDSQELAYQAGLDLA